jgi:deoxyribonuclease V
VISEQARFNSLDLNLKLQSLHDWPKNPNDAVKIQLKLKPELPVNNVLNDVRLIAAVDTAYNDENNRIYAAAVVLDYSDLNEVSRAVAQMDASFPYIPALRVFREGQVMLKALSRLKERPDVIMYPGHGIAHPRRIGLASHLGLITDIPSIGCARKCLTGEYRDPPPEKGSCSSLFLANVEVGFVYRTKSGVKPMFISPGHKCSIRDAVDVVVRCLTDYRMPEPLRKAHLYANKYKQSMVRKVIREKNVRANSQKRIK